MNSLVEKLILAILFVLTVLSGITTAVAHPLSLSYSSFRLEQKQVMAVYRLPMDDMDLLLRLDRDIDGVVSIEETRLASDGILAYLQKWTRISINGMPVAPQLQLLDIWQDNEQFPYVEIRVLYPSDNIIIKLDANVDVMTDLYKHHRNLAEFMLGDQREEHIFYLGNTWTGTRELQRTWSDAGQFIKLGIEHIFGGYDHILFLLGLLLVAGSLRRLVVIVTSFTVAHTITLALSAFGVIQPAAQMVEVIVAFSIAWVGLENLLFSNFRYRWILTFIFGLAHGFGFASVLQNMNLQREGLLMALLTFNLGVEIGQLLIVAVFWPALQQLARTRHRDLIVRLASVVILIFGTLWLVERLKWL
jgi:hypothetical protein